MVNNITQVLGLPPSYGLFLDKELARNCQFHSSQGHHRLKQKFRQKSFSYEFPATQILTESEDMVNEF